MPTIARIGPYRFFFYAGDGEEPPHIHVGRDEKEAKFWLEPVRLARSQGFKTAELNDLLTLVQENEQAWLERWNEYFDH